MSELVEIFTDGACRGNPGPGGWGALLFCNRNEKELYGAELNTTNNRMELTAAIEALESLSCECDVRLTTDSNYVKDGVTQWLKNWKINDWKTSKKKPVKNEDLWRRLDSACSRHKIEWCWVKGHSGHVENDRADALANKAIDQLI